MSVLAVAGLLLVLFLFGMDTVFDRIPRNYVQDGVEVNGANYMVEDTDYAKLTFYDPTVPEPDRWKPSNILIQLGHPTVRKVPMTWLAWRVGWREEPIDVYAYHNERPMIGLSRLPNLDPPLRLSDGSVAYALSDLEQVRTR